MIINYINSSTGDTTEVPVKYMSGNKIPHHRPSSAHSRSSGGAKRHSGGGALRERSTLSMKRTKKKKPAHSFKRRARQCHSTNTRAVSYPPDIEIMFEL